jgi:hypothetical protein
LITKRQFLDACHHEIAVVKHLATKVPPERLEWRPTPGQRSILELLRYLSACAVVPVRAMIAGSWDHAEAVERATEGVALETFGQAMDVQAQALEDMLAPLSERDLLEREAVLPWGTRARLGEALLTTGLKTLTAYRMQLFLYAKQAGASQLGPTNCWVGTDRATG